MIRDELRRFGYARFVVAVVALAALLWFVAALPGVFA